jgi:hypothetical protein
MQKIIIIFIALLLLVGASVVVGGNVYLGNIRSEIKPQVSAQVASFQQLDILTDEATALYQHSPSRPDNNTADVLGDSSALFSDTDSPQSDVANAASSVLGIEDSPEIQQARELLEVMTQATEAIDDIETVNDQLALHGGVNLLSSIGGVELPISATTDYLQKAKPTLVTLKEEAQLYIDATPLGTELVTILTMAITYPTEEYIVKLEEKLLEVQQLNDQEKAFLDRNIPSDLASIIEDSTQESDEMLDLFNQLPQILRYQDSQAFAALAVKIDALVNSSNQEGSTVALISFLRGDETLRSTKDLHDLWKASEAQL